MASDRNREDGGRRKAILLKCGGNAEYATEQTGNGTA